MLRRPLTVLTVTAEDIADYEDRAADRLRARDLLTQARARREAIAAHHTHHQQQAAAGAFSGRRRVLNRPLSVPTPNPHSEEDDDDEDDSSELQQAYPYASTATGASAAVNNTGVTSGQGLFSPPAAAPYEDNDSEEEEDDDDDLDGMDVDGASGIGPGGAGLMQVTPTMPRGHQQHVHHHQQPQQRVENIPLGGGGLRRAEEQERVLRGQAQGGAPVLPRGGMGPPGVRGGAVPAVTPEGRVQQRSREERIGLAAPQRRRPQ